MKRLYKETLPTYNEYIHDDNPYRENPPDFAILAKDYPNLDRTLFMETMERCFTSGQNRMQQSDAKMKGS